MLPQTERVLIFQGSHRSPHIIKTLELFPRLGERGLYVIEDTQTSYSRGRSGSGSMDDPTTCSYFKGLTDGLNHAGVLIPNYEASEVERTITGIYSAHNSIVIEKGPNDQPSNLVSNGELLNH